MKRVYLETLRIGRAASGPARRIWIQPEDDVPHIRDPLTRLRDAVGLRPAQLVAAADLTDGRGGSPRARATCCCAPPRRPRNSP